MSAVSLALAGCSEDVMDRINQDTSHTNSVDGKFILADLITSTAFSNVSGDFNTYSGWYAAAVVDVLDYMPAQFEGRDSIMTIKIGRAHV